MFKGINRIIGRAVRRTRAFAGYLQQIAGL
jgi:hypothetical protein